MTMTIRGTWEMHVDRRDFSTESFDSFRRGGPRRCHGRILETLHPGGGSAAGN